MCLATLFRASFDSVYTTPAVAPTTAPATAPSFAPSVPPRPIPTNVPPPGSTRVPPAPPAMPPTIAPATPPTTAPVVVFCTTSCVETVDVVFCALERSDFPGILLRAEHGVFLLALLAEQFVNLRLRLPRRAQFLALPLDVPLKAIELLLIPRSRHRSPRRH